jgi:hypothetical protein
LPVFALAVALSRIVALLLEQRGASPLRPLLLIASSELPAAIQYLPRSRARACCVTLGSCECIRAAPGRESRPNFCFDQHYPLATASLRGSPPRLGWVPENFVLHQAAARPILGGMS